MRHLFPAFVLLSLMALPGCTVEGCTDEEPAPACYSGKVVGAACMDGLLIEVDSQYAIGKPYADHSNLVAAVNLAQQSTPEYKIDGQVVQPGQTIYFTYTPSKGAREAMCPQNTVPLPVPHLTLSNVSTTGCGGATKAQ
ncbi:hypothetical protein [Hymenobacter metallicola]|uniref:Uncharacterized protein n=1 Tax=Hymenobacter metallicola TaxID=2563114 RepID=A0A4Z0PUW0_9BACT|nr:hypothetical protein [Hymenobacter metallicola]TGE21079.1 hypothetical protein E5K02_24005 [Hymenobacter metallicola]